MSLTAPPAQDVAGVQSSFHSATLDIARFAGKAEAALEDITGFVVQYQVSTK